MKLEYFECVICGAKMNLTSAMYHKFKCRVCKCEYTYQDTMDQILDFYNKYIEYFDIKIDFKKDC